MTCPAYLCIAHGGDGAGELCPLQHLIVRDFVLPADVGDGALTPVMELMELFLLSPVDSPGFTTVESQPYRSVVNTTAL